MKKIEPNRRRIASLIREGYPQKQAVAIAYREARARSAKENPSPAEREKAGRLAALADFRDGKLRKPSARDGKAFAKGYHDAVQELGDTFGRERIREMGGAVDKSGYASGERSNRANPDAPDYRATHGGRTGDFREKRVKLPDPKAGPLVVLGRLHRLEYVTDKGNGVSVYFHLLGRRVERGREDERSRPSEERQPWLVFNQSGLFIAGGQYEVRPEGIIG